MSEADSPSVSISLIQSMLRRLSAAEDTDQPPNTQPDTRRHLTASVETESGSHVTPQDPQNAELLFKGKLVAVIEDGGDYADGDDDPRSEVPTGRDNDLESSHRDSEEREEGNSGIPFLDAELEKLVDEGEEETSEPPAVIPRWERRQLIPCPPGLDTRHLPTPVPPKRRAKPRLPPPPALDCSQTAPVWGRVVGKGPGCELRPTGHGRGQEEDMWSSSGDRLSMYSALILKSERRFSQPILDSTAQRGGDPSQLRGKDVGWPPKASEPVEMGVMGVPKPLESTAPKPLIPKPPRKNRSLPQEPERKAQGSPDGSASSWSETRNIRPDLQPIPPGTEVVREPPEPSDHIADGNESSTTPAEIRCNTEEGGLLGWGRNLEGTQEVVVQDTATWSGGGVPGSKHPHMKKMGGKVKKFAKKMMSRWRESREERRGNGEIQEDDGEEEVEREMPLVNLHQHSVRLHSKMSVIEEEEEEEEEDEKRSGEATQESLMMEQPSQAETERKPVGHHGCFQSSFSSFKFNFSPISLVDEILTGEEWSPFLSIKDSPAPSPSVSQSEAASQHSCDDGDQLKTDVQQNHEDIGLSLYEDVSFSQSYPDEIVDNQSDDRQQEGNNNNDSGADAIAVIKLKILLDNDAAEKSELDHSIPISKDILDSVELCTSPIRTQSKDLLDCVESLGVLDSSAQKHKIRLSKKRKHRLPGLMKRKTNIFKITRTTIKAPEIKFLKPSPPPTNSPTSLPSSSSLSSSSSCCSPSYVFSSSVFYNIPPSAEEQDPGTSPTLDNLSVKTTEGSGKPGSSPKPPLPNFKTVLRDKTKRNLK